MRNKTVTAAILSGAFLIAASTHVLGQDMPDYAWGYAQEPERADPALGAINKLTKSNPLTSGQYLPWQIDDTLRADELALVMSNAFYWDRRFGGIEVHKEKTPADKTKKPKLKTQADAAKTRQNFMDDTFAALDAMQIAHPAISQKPEFELRFVEPVMIGALPAMSTISLCDDTCDALAPRDTAKQSADLVNKVLIADTAENNIARMNQQFAIVALDLLPTDMLDKQINYASLETQISARTPKMADISLNNLGPR